MAITIDYVADSAISLDEYVEFINDEVDTRDYESIVASAYMLGRLSLDRKLVPRAINTAVKNLLDQTQRLAYTPQSFILAETRQCYVRGNIWPSLNVSGDARSREAEVYSYLTAHDHSFDFVTCGYFGPGYSTRIFEVEPGSFIGNIGERVDLRFSEETSLPEGKLMCYRAYRDVHAQFPPESLTISLNLMCRNPDDPDGEQYFFDTETGRIVGHPAEGLHTRRAKLVQLAGLVGDEESLELLLEVATREANLRVRQEAIKWLMARKPDCLDYVRQRLCYDRRDGQVANQLLGYIDSNGLG